MNELDHLSWSSLTDAEHCLSLFSQRLAGASVDLLDKPRDTGTLVHKMQELHLKAVSRGVDNLEARAHDALCALPRLGYVYEEAKKLFEQWWKRFDVPASDWVAVERYGRCEIPNVPLPLDGYDDLVYRDGQIIVIRDSKSGRSSEVTAEYAFQGDLSCERYLATYPDSAVAWEIDFLRSGMMSGRVLYTPERREATVSRVQALWLAISMALESGRFDRTAGKWCGWCADLVNCTIGQQAAAQKLIIADPQSAQDAVLYINLLRETAKRLTANLKGYVDAKGPVTAGGLTSDYEPKKSYGIKDLDEVVKRKGLDVVIDSLTFGDKRKKSVRELMEDPELKDLVVVTKRSNKFNPGIKQGEVDDDEEFAE